MTGANPGRSGMGKTEIAMFHKMFSAANRHVGQWAMPRIFRLMAMSALLTLCCQPSVLAR